MTIKIAERGSLINEPWLDMHLPEIAMNHLWDIINHPQTEPEEDANKGLAGNISKSKFVEDTGNLFTENILNRWSEYMFLKDWNNYYEVIHAKTREIPKFELEHLWVNYQKQYEFNPSHDHKGAFSFVVFMKIPTHWKEQHALPNTANSNAPVASNFEFLLGRGDGQVQAIPIPLCSEDEGRMLFFPAWLKHQVYPFYGTEEERITVSGNIIYSLEEDKHGWSNTEGYPEGTVAIEGEK